MNTQEQQKTNPRLEKNLKFVQIYTDNINFFRAISRNPTAVDIMSLVFEHMDNNNHVVTSIKMLCKLTGKSKPAVYSAIKFLSSKSLIHVTNTGGMVTFICNSAVAWKSYAGRKAQYAVFNARVMIDESELPEKGIKLAKRNGVIYDKDTGEV